MYIGLISDTHGVFDAEVKHFLEPVDQIWHAGDWGAGYEFTQSISSLKPTIGVYGNCDGQDIRLTYPEHQYFECEGLKVLMIHIGGYPGRYDVRAKQLLLKYKPDLFICGHSHILRVMNDSKLGCMVMNPGACGIQGWHVIRTALRFRIENGKLKDCEVLKIPRKQ